MSVPMRTVNFCAIPGIPAQIRIFGGGIPEQVKPVNAAGQVAFQMPTVHGTGANAKLTGVNTFYEQTGPGSLPVPGFKWYGRTNWIQDGNVDGWLVDPNSLGYTPPFQAQWQTLIPLERSYPIAPTREQICRVRIGFQGLWARTVQFGTFPMFGPETTTLNDADLVSYCQQVLEMGFTHTEIAISWMYSEPDFTYPVPGRNLSQNLPELCRRIDLMLSTGITGVALFLAGDGESQPKNPDGSYSYNDPQGHTYGRAWLMDNLQRILTGLEADGVPRRKYVVLSPGYDGVFYGWNKWTDVVAFGDAVRAIWPDAHLALEHTPGNIPLGQGQTEWQWMGNVNRLFDVILTETAVDITPGYPGDTVCQVNARLDGAVSGGGTYIRDPRQPASDDPNPPYYNAFDGPRGPIYHVQYEYATGAWVRGRRTSTQIDQDRAYFRSIGAPIIC